MKKRIRGNLPIILALITTVIFSVGASMWLIIFEGSKSPSLVETPKVTPVVVQAPTFTGTYGDNISSSTITLNTTNAIVRPHANSTTPVSGEFSYDINTIKFGDANGAHSSQTYECTVILTFTPTNDNLYYATTVETTVTLYAVAQRDSNYYGTIEQALNAGNSGTVNVLNGLDVTPNNTSDTAARYSPKIKSNVEIDSGEILNLKYGSEADYGTVSNKVRNDSHRTGSSANFADSTTDKIITNLKNEVTLNNGVILTVNGTLNIGGVVGKEGQYLAGATSGNYSQITMQNNSQIIMNSGVIDCLGYIKEGSSNNGSLVTLNGGVLYMPFVIYNYGGGSHTVGAFKKGNISPFSIFDMPNIQSKMRCYSAAKIVGYADLYTGAVADIISAQHNKTDINVIGNSSCVINLTSGAYMDSKFTPYSAQITALYESSTNTSEVNARNSQGQTQITINGGGYLGAMNLAVSVLGKSETVSTEEVFFPISWKMNITLANGEYDINYKTKLMSGSSITVNQGATLNIGNEFILYGNGITSPAPNAYPSGKERAKLNIKGTVNVASTASFAGFVENGSSGGTLNIETTNFSLSSNEGVGDVDTSNKVDLGLVFANLKPIEDVCSFTVSVTAREIATANIYNSQTSISKSNLTKAVYYSNGNGWLLSKINLSYNSNGGTAVETKANLSTNQGGVIGYTLSSSDLPNISKAHYTFGGWYYDSSFNTRANVGDALYTNTMLYAKWTQNTYAITYSYKEITDTITDDGATNPNTLSSFTVNTSNVQFASPVLSSAYTDSYTFNRWYFMDGENKVTVETLNEILANNYVSANGDSIELIAEWITKVRVYSIGYDYTTYSENASSLGWAQSQTFNETQLANKPITTAVTIETNVEYQYYFVGWYADAEYTTLVENWDVVVDDNGELITDTIYAKWEEKYKLTYAATNHPGSVTSLNTSVTKVEWLSPADLASGYQIKTVTEVNTDKTDDILKGQDNTITQKYYYGDGWTKDKTTKIDSVTSADFTNKTLTLEVLWLEKVKIEVIVTNATVKLKDQNSANYEETNNSSYYGKPGQVISYSISFTASNNSTWSIEGAVETGLSGKSADEDEFTVGAEDITITASSEESSGGGCFAAGTLITLADGTQKKVEDLLETDVLLVFDHETGKYVAAPILFIERDGWANYNVINLEFSNGTKTKLIYEHALFDLTLNKYVYITESNYSDYVGHKFAVMNAQQSGYDTVTLTKAYVATEYTGCYSLVTAYHLNYFIDGLFSIPGGITGLFNYFEYDKDLKYDEEKMQADIAKYGLYTYEDFKDYVSYEVFEYAFAAKYFKVSVGKGLMTYEDILALIERYVKGHDLN